MEKDFSNLMEAITFNLDSCFFAANIEHVRWHKI